MAKKLKRSFHISGSKIDGAGWVRRGQNQVQYVSGLFDAKNHLKFLKLYQLIIKVFKTH